MSKSKPNAYYEGGHRIMLAGIPCRIARKPHSPNHAALLRQTAREFRRYPDPCAEHGYIYSADRHERRAKVEREKYEAAMAEMRAAASAEFPEIKRAA